MFALSTCSRRRRGLPKTPTTSFMTLLLTAAFQSGSSSAPAVHVCSSRYIYISIPIRHSHGLRFDKLTVKRSSWPAAAVTSYIPPTSYTTIPLEKDAKDLVGARWGKFAHINMLESSEWLLSMPGTNSNHDAGQGGLCARYCVLDVIIQSHHNLHALDC